MSRLYRVRHGDGGQSQFASRVDLFVGAIAYADRWLKIGPRTTGEMPK